MSGSVWTSVIILTTFLALVVRAFAGRRVSARQMVWMAVIWIAIIAGLALVFGQFRA